MRFFPLLSVCVTHAIGAPLLSNAQVAIEARDGSTPQQILTGQPGSDQVQSAIDTLKYCKATTLQHTDLSIDITIYDTHGNSIGSIAHAKPPPSTSAIDVTSQLGTILSVFSARNFLRFQYGLVGWMMTTRLEKGSSSGCKTPIKDDLGLHVICYFSCPH